MATATFVENDFGTATAWKLIYDSWWFEWVMLGLGVSFIFNIQRYRLWRKEKWAILLFHLSFILILVGAAVTRYYSTGGVMRIREGQSSHVIISNDNYLTVLISDGTQSKTVKKPLEFSPLGNNHFTLSTDWDGKDIQVSFAEFVADAVPRVKEDAENGTSLIELVVARGNGRETVYLEKGKTEKLGFKQGDLSIGFESDEKGNINLTERGDSLYIQTPKSLDFFVMADQSAGKIAQDSLQPLRLRTLYRNGDLTFVPLAYHTQATLELVSASMKPKDNDETKDDALALNVSSGGSTETITLMYRKGFLPSQHELKINGLTLRLSYGSEAILLPFALELRDFQLERYPGSTSPSSYASEVSILDGEKREPYRIFMNNVLDYRGYRFYQASYDSDELGTVLSVNQDRPGTYLTYAGYFLMGLGMFFTLFGRNSRFQWLNAKLKQTTEQRLGLVLLFLFLGAGSLPATEVDLEQEQNLILQQQIDQQHADLFGRLMVQDLDGRIKPVNTLASEFLRKISRKTQFKFEHQGEKVKLNANQVFLAMHVYPDLWRDISIIKVDREKGAAFLEGIPINESGHVALTGFIDEEGEYLLTDLVERANQKKPAERSELDKEVIKVDERFNILYNVFVGNYLKIFPNQNDENNTWFSYSQELTEFPEEDAKFVRTILPLYFRDIHERKWIDATEKLTYIKTYQEVLGKDILPSKRQVAAELWYNELNVNFWLFQVYFTLGFILLVLAIARIFTQSRMVNATWVGLIGITLISFIVFTGNLILRWYIAEHAPWSNGYEMLIFVTWVLMLCGLLTFRKSDFSLPLATLFSGALLFVSYLDWLNPEITNLMPVLKSYWLKIHVATIVSSYAPLALSAVMGMMVLVLMIIRTEKTKKAINLRIRELSYINEISMTIGLFVLAVGTFLGGVWANESWGRYWAWDPKETWALISIIVYAIVLHLRFVPRLNSKYVLNTASMFAFWSIIMTSFGVNYYLSGLHSYAAGDPMPIPKFVYVLVVIMVLLAAWAYFKEYRKSSS
ncbi:cytochrome c biogenesis protein CcsA [bacterium SCSIO 12741]|nr:cytochrome c biogenesis protein CcsA [bacterium SCSIO 12741]